MTRGARGAQAVGKRHAWKKLAPQLDGNRRNLLVLGGLSGLMGFVEAGVLVLIVHAATATTAGREQIDLTIGGISADGLKVTAALTIAAGLLFVVLSGRVLTSWLTATVSSTSALRIRKRISREFLDASWSLQAVEKGGSLQELMTTHVNAVGGATLQLASGLSALLSVVPLLISALIIDPVVAAVIGLTVLVLFLVLRPATIKAERHSRKHSRAGLRYASSLSETIALAMEIRTFGVQEPTASELDRCADRVEHPYRRQKFLAKLLPSIYQNVALLILLIGIAAVYLLDLVGLADLGAVVLILIRSLSYTQIMQSSIHSISELTPYIETLEDQSSRYRAAVSKGGPERLESVESICFDNVSFTYGSSPAEALSKISFQVNQGECIGIVGPSGSGKSTLLQLLLRLRDPSSGQYLVNGRAASSYNLAAWSSAFALVAQEPRLFNGNVRDNIRFHRRSASDDNIEVAARLAHIHDDIRSWPEGYAYEVGGRGGNAVSGGQRQRICIARALLMHPHVLILDEPTSALDLRSESLFQETLADLRRTTTMFVIAHRVSTLNQCDRIMVFNTGRLETIDTPEALRAGNEFFRDSVRLSQV